MKYILLLLLSLNLSRFKLLFNSNSSKSYFLGFKTFGIIGLLFFDLRKILSSDKSKKTLLEPISEVELILFIVLFKFIFLSSEYSGSYN